MLIFWIRNYQLLNDLRSGRQGVERRTNIEPSFLATMGSPYYAPNGIEQRVPVPPYT